MPTSDSDLVLRIARQDRDAFAELYARYGQTSLRLAQRLTRDAQLAEQVVQEVFLVVWLAAARFDPGRARPATWLLAITHHKAVDVVRREQLRRAAPDDLLEQLADESVDLHRELRRGEQAEAIRRALATLPERQREVIELAYFGGFSQRQLARHLGQPLGTIKSRTQTSLARLRAALELAETAAGIA